MNYNRSVMSIASLLLGVTIQAFDYFDFPYHVRRVYQDVVPWVYVDFDESMQSSNFAHIINRDKTAQLVGITGPVLIDFFKKQYEQFNFLQVFPEPSSRIPKIIHQIWIGDFVPEELKQFQESWKLYHPDWEYKLWTQDDIPHLSLYNKKLIEIAENPAELSDLLRYEILYQQGGVYIDMDFECLQPLDVLHHAYDFYIGIQPLDTGLVQLGIGIIGTTPGHPILKKCIESLEENYKNKKLRNTLTAKTGPIHLTKIFVAHAGKEGMRDVALPVHYFYPLGSTQIALKKRAWTQKGSFGIHHWAKTWNKPCYRRPQFRSIQSWGTLL